MLIGRAAIARLIPHAGAMCLLDAVLAWDDQTISCRTARHHAPGNPLARAGRLHALCGVELAAQAMALHGRLAGGATAPPRAARLASLRDLVWRVERLDLVPGDLLVEAERLIGAAARAVYGFRVSGGGGEVLRGRAAVLLDAPLPGAPLSGPGAPP